ncbi:hypothetical protein GCM10027175_05500 [Hymenobacter latericoloratus]
MRKLNLIVLFVTTTKIQPVHRSYGTARGWRIFIYVFGPLLIALFWSAPFWMLSGDWNALRIGFTVGMGLFGLFFVYCLYETAKGRHIITDTAFVYAGTLYRQELPLEAIKGFRTDQQYTHILPTSKAYPKIKVGYTSEGYKEIQQWLAEHYPNLDEQEQQQEEEAILLDDTFGRTTEERETNLTQTRRVASALNTLGWLTGAWLLFLPRFYEAAFTAGLTLPAVAALAILWHRGTIRPDEQKNSAYPNVSVALLMPALGLLLRELLDLELLHYDALWPLAGGAAALFGLLLLLGSRPFLQQPKLRASVLGQVALYALLYGYAATVAVNCVFDEGPAKHHTATVLRKHSSSGKTTTYYLNVTPWGPRRQAEDVAVSEEYYQQVQPGARVRIYEMPGRLGVPWFTVAE